MGHPVLRAKAAPVPPGQIRSPGVQRLIDDMFETMREYAGIGLAAPQIHQSFRLFVAGLRKPEENEKIVALDDDDNMPFIVVINPEITAVGDTMKEGWEGCLSIPDIRGLVPRATNIKVSAYNRNGEKMTFTASGLSARVIQHETDHLDGVLFFDRMPTLESLAFMDEYRRFWTGPDEDDEDAE